MTASPASLRGFLLLADISGYTSFLSRTELDHAHEIVSEFVELIVSRLTSVFDIVKLEGDAVFAHIPLGTLERNELILESIEDTYAAFRNRIVTVRRKRSCNCASCSSIPSLDLKFVLHSGEYVQRSIAGKPDLLGNDVNVIHRLLKNGVVASTGWKAYVLMTENAVSDMGIGASEMARGREEYEHIDPILTYSYDLHRRLEEMTAARPWLTEVAASDWSYSKRVKAPPSIVWEWLNDPLKRGSMDNSTISLQTRSRGRMGEGAVLHCAHGKNVEKEEIVEWRPFSSFAYLHRTSIGPILFVHDIVPTDDEVRLDVRVKLKPELAILRPFSRSIVAILSRAFSMRKQYDDLIRMAAEDWEKRTESHQPT